MDMLGDNLSTNIPPLKAPQLGRKMLRIDFDSVRQGYIPGKGTYINGIYYYIVDEEGMQKTMEKLNIR